MQKALEETGGKQEFAAMVNYLSQGNEISKSDLLQLFRH
jgi:hypothetical protein